MGVFDALDILKHFAIITNVITLDRSYLKTHDLTEMKYAATQNEYGYNLMVPSAVVNCLVQLLTNPGSPEEANKMNTALKSIDVKKNRNSERFYELLEEVLSRLLFQKMAQIYSPLIEEVKTNKELIIILVNNKLINMTHLEELAGSSDTEVRIAHYIIHSINSYRKLRRFANLCSNWCRDTNLVEQVLEIQFEIECFQIARLDDLLNQDEKRKSCLIY